VAEDCLQLIQRIEDGRARVCVIGLGYVGLPLAVGFARRGYQVVGLDVDGRKVATLIQGESYIQDVESEAVAELVGTGTFVPTTD
jgi:UDP-N-acetyl-D-glucosamine dehydrogenase